MKNSLRDLLKAATVSTEDNTKIVVQDGEVHQENTDHDEDNHESGLVFEGEVPEEQKQMAIDAIKSAVSTLEALVDCIDPNQPVTETTQKLFHMAMSNSLEGLEIPIEECLGMESVQTATDMIGMVKRWVDGLNKMLLTAK